jgi:hypothetical protein
MLGTTPSARLRMLRGFFLIAQPPLLGEEGKSLFSSDSKPHMRKSTSCQTRMGRGFPVARAILFGQLCPEGGVAAPIKQMERCLRFGEAGEVKHVLREAF